MKQPNIEEAEKALESCRDKVAVFSGGYEVIDTALSRIRQLTEEK